MQTVPQVILAQLGGRRFRAMTGASNFLGSADTLVFMLPGRGGFVKHGINKVRITLDPSDTYTVEFYRVRPGQATLKARCEDIYCDQLQECFTRETGLATHL